MTILGAFTHADATCRAADRRLESEVRTAIEAGDIGALVARAYQPVAVRLLSHGIYSRVFADLLSGGFPLPLRVMRGLGLGESHKTFTKAATVRKLRAATGRKAEIIRALLTGEGDPAAVMLRRLAEAVRGDPLPIYDLSEAATREPLAFEERSESSKRAAVTRAERDKGSPKSRGTSVTPPEPKRKPTMRLTPPKERKANVAKRKAERERCELSERVGYVESVRRGER